MHTNKRLLKRAATSGLVALACFASANAFAVKVKVTVDNLNDEGGLWFTPVFVGFHSGAFDTYDMGDAASTNLETLAETGDPSGLIADVEAVGGIGDAINQPAGPGPGLFAPGTSNYKIFDLDPTANQLLHFASMLLPSNDAFFGNDVAIEIFDDMGHFVGLDKLILGMNIYDSGTEENDGNGAPFSTIGVGEGPGMTDIASTDTSPIVGVAKHLGLDDPFLGTVLATGSELTSTYTDYSHVARIRVEQVPDSVAHIGLMSGIALLGFQFVARRRMGKK